MAGAKTIVELILKKWGDDAARSALKIAAWAYAPLYAPLFLSKPAHSSLHGSMFMRPVATHVDLKRQYTGLKIPRRRLRAGSSPAPGTIFSGSGH
jgi:hypothetical protein